MQTKTTKRNQHRIEDTENDNRATEIISLTKNLTNQLR